MSLKHSPKSKSKQSIERIFLNHFILNVPSKLFHYMDLSVKLNSPNSASQMPYSAAMYLFFVGIEFTEKKQEENMVDGS